MYGRFSCEKIRLLSPDVVSANFNICFIDACPYHRLNCSELEGEGARDHLDITSEEL